jgi:ferric-dicitrate binding protein FerR (iron transport regulator)
MAELLERRRDGDLDQAEAAELADLLADAPSRAKALVQLRVTLLVEAAVACRPPEVMAELVRGVATGPNTGRIRRLRSLASRAERRPRAWWVALAAGLLVAASLLLAVGLVVWWPQNRGIGACVNGGRTTVVVAGATLRAASRPLTVVFHDGTRLELAVGTEITLVAGQDFHGRGPAKRIRQETGTLTAEVARQPAGAPLTIATLHAQVIVVGTRFQLAARRDQTLLKVTEGKIKLIRESDQSAVEVNGGFFAIVGADPGADIRVMKLDGTPSATANPAGKLEVGYGDKGINRMAYEGVVLVDRTANNQIGELFKVCRYRLRRGDGTREDVQYFDDHNDHLGAVLTFKPNGESDHRLVENLAIGQEGAAKTPVWELPWGRVGSQYLQTGERLDLAITVANTTADATLEGLSIRALAPRFPRMPDGFTADDFHVVQGRDGPQEVSADYGAGRLTVGMGDPIRPSFGFIFSGNKPVNTLYPIIIDTIPSYDPDGPKDRTWPFFNRPLGPGASEVYHLSLRFQRSEKATPKSERTGK